MKASLSQPGLSQPSKSPMPYTVEHLFAIPHSGTDALGDRRRPRRRPRRRRPISTIITISVTLITIITITMFTTIIAITSTCIIILNIIMIIIIITIIIITIIADLDADAGAVYSICYIILYDTTPYDTAYYAILQ